MSWTAHDTAIVEDGATIGDSTAIWHHSHVRSGATLGDHCSLGKNVYIDSGVIIGSRVKIQNNVSVYHGVTIADDVFLGPSCVFTNVKYPRAHVPRRDEFTATHVGRGVTIGANATIVCGVTIGAYALVGAGAVVTTEVVAHAIVVGAPARRTGWACRCGAPLPADLICTRCGDAYDETTDDRWRAVLHAR